MQNWIDFEYRLKKYFITKIKLIVRHRWHNFKVMHVRFLQKIGRMSVKNKDCSRSSNYITNLLCMTICLAQLEELTLLRQRLLSDILSFTYQIFIIICSNTFSFGSHFLSCFTKIIAQIT